MGKTPPGMQDLVNYMDLDTGFREGVSRGSGFWTALFVVLFVFVLLILFLRIYVRRVADRKTRRIILESMREDGAAASPAPSRRPSSGEDVSNAP